MRQDFNPALATTIRPLLAIATRCLKTSGVSQANGFSGSQTARYSLESGSSIKIVPVRSGRKRGLMSRSPFHRHSKSRQTCGLAARIMLAMGLFLGAVLVPIQIFFGHLTGDYVHGYQPAKFAAIEGRWHDEQPAGEVLLAIPDPASETNHYEIKIPVLGSLIGSMSLHSKE